MKSIKYFELADKKKTKILLLLLFLFFTKTLPHYPKSTKMHNTKYNRKRNAPKYQEKKEKKGCLLKKKKKKVHPKKNSGMALEFREI